MIRISPLFCGTALAVAMITGTTQAAIIFNNFGPGDSFGISGRVVQGPAVGSIGDVNQAAAFVTGPSDAFLTSVSLGINVMDPPNIGTGPIDIELAVDAGGVPGAVLRSLSVNAGVTGEQVITGVDDGSQLLTANTTYWIVADGEGSFDGSWRFNSISDVGMTAGQTEPNPWNAQSAEDRYAFRVEARVVPEPTNWLLFLGSIGFALIRRSHAHS